MLRALAPAALFLGVREVGLIVLGMMASANGTTTAAALRSWDGQWFLAIAAGGYDGVPPGLVDAFGNRTAETLWRSSPATRPSSAGSTTWVSRWSPRRWASPWPAAWCARTGWSGWARWSAAGRGGPGWCWWRCSPRPRCRSCCRWRTPRRCSAPPRCGRWCSCWSATGSRRVW
ncbi:hypothetical protein ACFQV2_00865 [Actinokineospora soli]|uniref:Uncharacterized protein n=1 Tax=Actinokineospora soli TaxID=1048753 RepID=A0ABW2TFA7_9PSEU